MQVCNKCNIVKQESDFYVRKSGVLQKKCKKCTIQDNYEKRFSKRKYIPINNLDGEEWRWVVGFEGLYMVSNMGRVKSMARWVEYNLGYKKYFNESLLKGSTDSDGYCIVGLTKDKVMSPKKVHRLVGIAFIPNPENKPEVNHKWGDKTDNRASELEWSTTKENHDHLYEVLKFQMPTGEKHGNSVKIVVKTPKGEVFTIKGIAEASRRLNLCCSSIKRVLNGSNADYLGYKFNYE